MIIILTCNIFHTKISSVQENSPIGYKVGINSGGDYGNQTNMSIAAKPTFISWR